MALPKSYLIVIQQEDLQSMIYDCIKDAFRLNKLAEKEELPSSPTSDTVRIDGAEEETGLRRQRIYQLVAENKIPHFKIGRVLRFSRKDLRAWVAAGKPEMIKETA